MKKEVFITDVTLREESHRIDNALSFKEKIEIAKLLSRLNVDVIEFSRLMDINTDTLLIQTVSSLVENSTLSIPVDLSKDSIDEAANALKLAKKPRLVLSVPTSPIQMTYKTQKKPAALISIIDELIRYAVSKCPDVEFVADDATRSEMDFLCSALDTAISAGASAVTVCDNEGILMPDDFAEFIKEIRKRVPSVDSVIFGVENSDSLGVATASGIQGIFAGANSIKTAISSSLFASFSSIANIIQYRGDRLSLGSNLRYTELMRIASQIDWITNTRHKSTTPFDNGAGNTDVHIALDKSDSLETVIQSIKKLGYDLSQEDNVRVFEAFRAESQKKDIGAKELDAIIASTALQVPATYQLVSYVINSGNIINSTAHIQLKKNDVPLDGLSVGDGPIDAAFLAIEQIVGRHYELDNFQIQAVTEGREALGSALVRLRSNGMLYSGNGISTDIIGASIRAYINALNKIIYEEDIQG